MSKGERDNDYSDAVDDEELETMSDHERPYDDDLPPLTGKHLDDFLMALVDRGYAEYNKETDCFRGTPKAKGLTEADLVRIQREGRPGVRQ